MSNEVVVKNGNQSKNWKSLTSDWLGFAYRILDCLLLFGVLTYQNCYLSYYITSFNSHNKVWFLLFVVDFVLTFFFMFGAISAIRYYRKLHVFKRKNNSSISQTEVNQSSDNSWEESYRLFGMRLPSWMGALPLVWICWFVYVIVMSAKMFMLHLQNIAIQLYLSSEGSGHSSVRVDAEPHTLRLCLGAMTVVFLLWIEVHRNNKSHQSLECVKELTTTVVFEIFDSIDLLDLLTPETTNDRDWDSSHSEKLSIIILVLTAINLLLPTIGLFRLSQSRFNSHKLGLRMNILHNCLRIGFINVPYMILRISFWLAIKREISIFLLKNALFLFVSIRHIVSELHELRKSDEEIKDQNSLPLRAIPEKQSSDDEIDP